MKGKAARQLASELGSALPAEFGTLDEEQLEVLRQAYSDARQTQTHELDDALTRALEHVPTLMRRPVRKILGI